MVFARRSLSPPAQLAQGSRLFTAVNCNQGQGRGGTWTITGWDGNQKMNRILVTPVMSACKVYKR